MQSTRDVHASRAKQRVQRYLPLDVDAASKLAAALLSVVVPVPLLLTGAQEPVEVRAADDVGEHERGNVQKEDEPLVDHLDGHVTGAVVSEGGEGDVLDADEEDEAEAAEEVGVEEREVPSHAQGAQAAD